MACSSETVLIIYNYLITLLCREETQMSLASVLEPLTSAVQGDELVVIVNRRSVLKSAAMALKTPQFDFNRPVRVVFAGEEAVDDGGPRREFFR